MTKEAFVAIPARAMRDPEMSSGRLWRVLAAVASHARFNRNGAGCYAGLATLSAETGIDEPNISRCLNDLCGLGYLQMSTLPIDRRRRTYMVVYTDEDRTVMRGRRGVITCQIRQPIEGEKVAKSGNQLAESTVTGRYGTVTPPLPAEIDNHSSEILARSHSKNGSTPPETIPEYILRSSSLIDSAEAAHADASKADGAEAPERGSGDGARHKAVAITVKPQSMAGPKVVPMTEDEAVEYLDAVLGFREEPTFQEMVQHEVQVLRRIAGDGQLSMAAQQRARAFLDVAMGAQSR